MTSKVFPFHSTSVMFRSRVEPATESTIALRSPLIRLNRVDLPTFGRPTMATLVGALTLISLTYQDFRTGKYSTPGIIPRGNLTRLFRA